MQLDEKIRKLRKDHGWSQAELSQKLEVHLSHVSKLEKGKYSPSLDVLRKLVEVFEVPAEYFLFESADAVTPLNLKEKSLYEKIRLVQELGDHEKDIILGVIESFLMNKRIMSLINKEVVGA